MARSSKKPSVVSVDDYPERPLADALADPDALKAYENRPEKDQIEDYHQKHPTLKAGPAHEFEPPVADEVVES